MKTSTKTLWLDGSSSPFGDPLRERLGVDYAVIGAGITGLTTALQLQQRGHRVAVLERFTVGAGETGHTTAHLTEVLDTPYSTLLERFGEERTAMLRDASRYAIDQINDYVQAHAIDCQFKFLPGYRFSEDERGKEELQQDAEALRSIGGHVTVGAKMPLPFPVTECLKVTNQAQFHPIQYLRGLAKAFVNLGGRLFEHTTVREIQEREDCELVTDGGTIVARKVIHATNLPPVGSLFLQSRLQSYRSYAIAVRLARPIAVPGLFWDTEDPYHYVRGTSDGLIIVGGADHKTGQNDNEDSYVSLEKYVQHRLGRIESIPYRWSGQIIEPLDGVPYIGRSLDSERSYIATGFSGNGMTWGTVAAKVLTDLITEQSHPWIDLFDSSRKRPFGPITDYVAENKDYPVCMIRDRLAEGSEVPLDQIWENEGAIVRMDGRKVAVNRDASGNLRFFSPVCPHMGCLVRWNKAEASWDCPCHGSRFDADGSVLNGPATCGLTEVSDDIRKKAA